MSFQGFRGTDSARSTRPKSRLWRMRHATSSGCKGTVRERFPFGVNLESQRTVIVPAVKSNQSQDAAATSPARRPARPARWTARSMSPPMSRAMSRTARRPPASSVARSVLGTQIAFTFWKGFSAIQPQDTATLNAARRVRKSPFAVMGDTSRARAEMKSCASRSAGSTSARMNRDKARNAYPVRSLLLGVWRVAAHSACLASNWERETPGRRAGRRPSWSSPATMRKAASSALPLSPSPVLRRMSRPLESRRRNHHAPPRLNRVNMPLPFRVVARFLGIIGYWE